MLAVFSSLTASPVVPGSPSRLGVLSDRRRRPAAVRVFVVEMAPGGLCFLAGAGAGPEQRLITWEPVDEGVAAVARTGAADDALVGRAGEPAVERGGGGAFAGGARGATGGSSSPLSSGCRGRLPFLASGTRAKARPWARQGQPRRLAETYTRQNQALALVASGCSWALSFPCRTCFANRGGLLCKKRQNALQMAARGTHAFAMKMKSIGTRTVDSKSQRCSPCPTWPR